IRKWCGLPQGPLFQCAWIFDHMPPLPEELLAKTNLDLVCEHEVPAAGDEAHIPELRVARRGQEILVTLRGCVPGDEGEAKILLEELDAMLLLFSEENVEKYTVHDLLRAVPLAPCSCAPMVSLDDQVLENFWRERLMHEAELPRSFQGASAASPSWQSLPFLLPSTSVESVIAALAGVLGEMSGQEEVSVLVPLGGEEPTGWFPLCLAKVQSDFEVAAELTKMEKHALVPRYALERLMARPSRPSAAVLQVKGPACGAWCLSTSLQQWGE
ncbi:unnamed protein product, partial [Durusdinium trenchii]